MNFTGEKFRRHAGDEIIMNFEPPPLPPGYGENRPASEPSPPPRPSPPSPSPRHGRFAVRVIWVFLLAAGLGLYFGPLSVRITFTDDRGRVPPEFVVTVRRGETEKKILVNHGQLRLLRWRWTEIEVTDVSYIASEHPVEGRHMDISIVRNTSRKLKDAARGSSSIPQRGDPDPRHER